jgi:hypothetical protein
MHVPSSDLAAVDARKLTADAQARMVARFERDLEALPQIDMRLRPAMTGLRNVVAGRPLGHDGGQMLLGWWLGPHPFVLPAEDECAP